MSRHSKTTPYAREQKIVLGMFGVLFVLFCAYVYFVSASVVHVIVRKEIDREIATVSSHMSDLETRYIEAKKELDETRLAQEGFTQVAPDKIYIRKVPTSLVLATENEI